MREREKERKRKREREKDKERERACERARELSGQIVTRMKE